MAQPEPAAPVTFVVPGSRPARRSGGAPPQPAGLPGRLKDAVQVSARRGPGVARVRLVAVPGEDVVVLRIQGGPVLVLHPHHARDLLLAQAGAARGQETPAWPDEVEVGARLRWRTLEAATPARGGGFGEALLAAVEVVTGVGREAVADLATSALVARLDGQVETGVYGLDAASLEPLAGSGRRVAAVPASAAPLLVLLHGTFVDTAGTFGALWRLHPARVQALFEHYGGRVYAFDHPTLGASPVANALALAEALPAGARLHLATHSRGGLVAEVLARAAAAEPAAGELERHFPDTHAAQRADLLRLSALLKARGVKVERVVRVGCPARGTLLASGRLDAYLSVLKWALALGGVPVGAVLTDLLMEVARRRADPAQLPGLEAMMPDSPLLGWLHAGAVPLPGELRVIAGDQQGDSVGSWVKTLLADAFYRTDNDIVVQTGSMYGGAPRQGSASFLLDRGGRVDHFRYFVNERTAEALVSALVQPGVPPGFQAIGPLSWAGRDAGGLRASARHGSSRAGARAARPAVVLLPGLLGTHLAVRGRRVWLGPGILGGLAQLAWRAEADDVTPEGPIGAVYDDLADHLAQEHELIAFGYDWRRPLEDEARRLGQVLSAALDARRASGQPVRLLAHSMGGLLARTLQLECPQVWQRWLAHPEARLLMLGTPNQGSWAPMQVLSGDDTFGNAVAALGWPLQDRQARQAMAGMPGFMQLQAGLLDPALGLAREETWRELADTDLERVQQALHWHRTWLQQDSAAQPLSAWAWGVPPQAVLDRACALWRRLEAQRTGALAGFADRLLIVAGRAPLTPAGVELRAEGVDYPALRHGGDGRVTLASALLPGVRAWQAEADHGGLASDASAFEAYAELLARGSTARLPALGADAGSAPGTPEHTRPSRSGGMSTPPIDMRAVFACTAAAPPRGGGTHGAAGLHVEVLNGDLAFVAQPLMVGHYRSLALTGTERAVDTLVGGALSRALALGLYPEAPGTHQILANRRVDPANPWRLPRPAAVIVLGLGDEGTLREAELAHAVMRGALAHAQRAAEAGARPGEALELAATLLGSGGMGMSPAAAARDIVRGVLQANQRLAAGGLPGIGRLTLVEVYLDRASDAWSAVRLLADSRTGPLELAPLIRTGRGASRRQPDSNYRSAGHDLVSINCTADGRLEYTLDTRRARTEVRAHMTQAKLVRELVARASADPDDDPQLGRTLFQLLVPPELEAFLGAGEPTVLELDDTTAAIPWELLDGGAAPDATDRRPWALRSRLLRKRRTTRWPGAVRDAMADDAVLVIGEPLAPPQDYAALPGAAAEAEAVAAALSASLGPERVTALQHADAPAVVNALLSRAYRIMHVAGHGEPPLGGQPRGVVLSGGAFLGAPEIESMRCVPELVFVNCCHLARVSGELAPRHFDRSAFAAGVAEALIAVGVRCVVAAGWAVDDGPAQAFAEAFYAALLDGSPYADAVAAGRGAAWQADPDGRTWAAYQCYGDPGWTYRRRVGDAQANAEAADAAGPVPAADDVASPVALALWLEDLARRAAQAGGTTAGLHAGAMAADAPPPGPRSPWAPALRAVESRFGTAWGAMGAVAEAFAVAWQAAGGLDEAVRWYERAVGAADASASMRAQEQLANLLAQQAWRRAGGAGADAARAQAGRGAIARALALLQALQQVQPTAERFALAGSALKRLARIEQQQGRRRAADAALERAAAAYRQAEALARAAGDPEAFHPALNGMAIEYVRHGARRGWPGLAPGRVAFVRDALGQRMQHDPDFWCAVGRVEIEFLDALAGRRLAAAAAALEAALDDVHARVPAPAAWASVAEQMAFLLGRLQAGPRSPERDAAERLLARVRSHAGPGD